MTSKEALEELVYYSTLDDSGFEPTMKDYAKIIEKDLKILEILKKYIVINLMDIDGICLIDIFDKESYKENTWKYAEGISFDIDKGDFDILKEYSYTINNKENKNNDN